MAAPAGGEQPRACADCGAPLDARQRYCLHCGRRAAPRSAQLAELQRRMRRQAVAGAPAATSAASARQAGIAEQAQPSGAARLRGRLSPDALIAGLSQTRLPSARVSTLLVLAFAGFGVLLGSVAGSPVSDSLAASAGPPVKVLLPTATTRGGAGQEATSASEPPLASAEETPAAAPEAPEVAGATVPAPTSRAPGKSNARGGEQAKKGTPAPAAHAPASKLPAIDHVFVIMLSDEPYAATFGPESKAPYLSKTLERRGALLVRYYAVAHEQLANGIALLSGQGPTQANAANCPLYAAVAPATTGAEQQVAGDGCVYPATTPTLPGQLEVMHRSWRAYVQGIDETAGTPPACAHPALGQSDAGATAPATQPYARFRNPFVYFQGLTESPSCAHNDVGLSSLDADLTDLAKTPSFAYIAPDRCHDGSPGPCPGGGPGGLPAADALLAQIVPKILASPAYKHGGMLVITADEAPSTGEFADSSSCCGQPRYPNLPPATGVAASLPAEGGGQVGALLLSPFIKGHTVSQEPYNHYSLLRSIEDLFALKHLGYASGPHVGSLEPSLFSAHAGR